MINKNAKSPDNAKGAKSANMNKSPAAGGRFHWAFEHASSRRLQFWVDIETTALGNEIVEFGPPRFERIATDLAKQKGLANK